MTDAFKLALIWIVGCMLAFVMALNLLPSSLVDGQYIPVSNDSFYHARRILDTVADPASFSEFDNKMHYPEGSWIVWPWGFDYLVAQGVRAALWVFGPREPMNVLVYVPVATLTITLALIAAIATALRLSMPMRIVVVICFAISPLTQALHGVGMIDHHFVEHIFLLASVWLGMLWFRRPDRVRLALAPGFVLGFSVAFHTGLFILQVPFLAALLLLWVRGVAIGLRPALLFAAGLLAGTALAVAPSQSLWRGNFDFFLLSWFHVYIAACTAIVTVMLGRPSFRFGPRSAIALVAACGALVLPIAAQLYVAGGFVTAQLDVLKGIDEIKSPVRLAFDAEGAGRISRLYGLFIWVVPLLAVVVLIQLVRERRPDFVYFWVASGIGLVLLSLQLRFHYFGSLALYIVPFWWLDQVRAERPRLSIPILALAWLVLAVGLAPSIRMHLINRYAVSGDVDYGNTRAVYPVLQRACNKAPGLVLANADQGHYVRYHTDCSVLANNFRLTRQHAEKLAELDELRLLSPEELIEQAPAGLRYVLATMVAYYATLPDGGLKETPPDLLFRVNPRLDIELLLRDPSELPPRYKLLSEVRFDKKLPFPIARVYELLPEDPLIAPQPLAKRVAD